MTKVSLPADEGRLTKALLELVTKIPESNEVVCQNPQERAQAIARSMAIKAAGVSGMLALPPGPLGFATIFPDLLLIWRIQQAMVADIAAVYGKTACLRRETMIYCLFKHGGAALLRDLVVRTGQRYLIKRAALNAIQQILKKLGVRVSQRVIGRGLARWLPLVGSVGIGAYAYYDTAQIAATSIELFSGDIEFDD